MINLLPVGQRILIVLYPGILHAAAKKRHKSLHLFAGQFHALTLWTIKEAAVSINSSALQKSCICAKKIALIPAPPQSRVLLLVCRRYQRRIREADQSVGGVRKALASLTHDTVGSFKDKILIGISLFDIFTFIFFDWENWDLLPSFF